MTDGQYYGAIKLCHNIAAIYCCVCHRPKMATNVNIYLAGVVVAVALANRRRRAANLMRVPCLSEEGDHFSRKQAKYCRK